MNKLRAASPVAAFGMVAALATACGDDEPDHTLEITSPTEGSVVSVPFEIAIDASVPIGPPESEQHHVHVWFGDDEDAYQVVEASVVEINNAPTGEQEMFVSLRNPDHSAAGVETSVRLVISEGSGAGGGVTSSGAGEAEDGVTSSGVDEAEDGVTSSGVDEAGGGVEPSGAGSRN